MRGLEVIMEPLLKELLQSLEASLDRHKKRELMGDRGGPRMSDLDYFARLVRRYRDLGREAFIEEATRVAPSGDWPAFSDWAATYLAERRERLTATLRHSQRHLAEDALHSTVVH